MWIVHMSFTEICFRHHHRLVLSSCHTIPCTNCIVNFSRTPLNLRKLSSHGVLSRSYRVFCLQLCTPTVSVLTAFAAILQFHTLLPLCAHLRFHGDHAVLSRRSHFVSLTRGWEPYLHICRKPMNFFLAITTTSQTLQNKYLFAVFFTNVLQILDAVSTLGEPWTSNDHSNSSDKSTNYREQEW